jgi:tetratricopeptide (TPR) repeat protein
MLQVQLSLRHPGARFEVVNAAVTAINSHVIRDIARDCARADGDIWVVYMGNNEVVGPYGDGTIFGRQMPPLPVIRASLAVKGTRLGQMVEALLLKMQPPSDRSGWGGMRMFLDHQVRADDPRMKTTYDYFGRNLADILDYGRKAGVGIVASTVAVNLKDCAPFASQHRANLSASELEKWDRCYQSGVQAQNAGKFREADDDFRQAARYDDTFAELRFRQGQCALELHDLAATRSRFKAARDLDTLRFRCDREINELIRGTVSRRQGERILLADAERAFAEHSPDALPGNEFFYEHVHLNIDGNYLLARTIGEQVEKLLPAGISAAGNAWPSEAECERRMGWSRYDELEAAREIAARLRNPPFTGQLNHDAQVARFSRLAQELAPAENPAGLREAERICDEARRAAPDDYELDYQSALLKMAGGDLSGAITALKRELDALPADAGGWGNLGLFLSHAGKLDEAADAFERALELDPLDSSLEQRIAHARWQAGRREGALAHYRKALRLRPNAAIAWLEMGGIFEELGQKAKAEECYGRALACRGLSLEETVALAHFSESRSWYEAASTNYLQAIRLDPMNAKLRVDAGGNFALWGRNAEAEEQFRQVLALQPDSVKTRMNLAVALMKQSRNAEALAELDTVLRQDPTNTLARQYASGLRKSAGSAEPAR